VIVVEDSFVRWYQDAGHRLRHYAPSCCRCCGVKDTHLVIGCISSLEAAPFYLFVVSTICSCCMVVITLKSKHQRLICHMQGQPFASIGWKRLSEKSLNQENLEYSLSRCRAGQTTCTVLTTNVG
jgi:hypothetical protein